MKYYFFTALKKKDLYQGSLQEDAISGTLLNVALEKGFRKPIDKRFIVECHN